jgi:hypothetical protein
VEYLQKLYKDTDVAVAFIYCNYKEQVAQTARNLVASLLKQLVQNSRVTSDNIKSFYRDHQDAETHPTLDEFTKALRSELRLYSRAFIIVDALDECPEHDEIRGETRADLVEALRTLDTVNLMLTSRDMHSIAQQFHGTPRLEIRAHDHDVQKYIEGRITRVPRRHLVGLKETIVSKIIEKADGM